MYSNLRLAAAVLSLASALAAQAAPVVFFGENQSPATFSPPVTGIPVTARAAFLSNLAPGVSTETFESFAVSSTPSTLSFAGSSSTITATLSGTSAVRDTSSVGRWNTTTGGSKWLDTNGNFAIDFLGTTISAFGFYATDIGDFNGRVTLALTDTSNVVTTLTVNSTINGNDGSVLFWGFTDSSNTYKRIAFSSTISPALDGFGFDDMVIGDRAQIAQPTPTVPEPGSLALVGLSLLGLAASRRKARA